MWLLLQMIWRCNGSSRHVVKHVHSHTYRMHITFKHTKHSLIHSLWLLVYVYVSIDPINIWPSKCKLPMKCFDFRNIYRLFDWNESIVINLKTMFGMLHALQFFPHWRTAQQQHSNNTSTEPIKNELYTIISKNKNELLFKQIEFLLPPFA